VLTKGDQYRAPMRQIEQDAKKSLEDRRTLMLDRCFVAKSKGGFPPAPFKAYKEYAWTSLKIRAFWINAYRRLKK
jgi:hypothetical protein